MPGSKKSHVNELHFLASTRRPLRLKHRPFQNLSTRSECHYSTFHHISIQNRRFPYPRPIAFHLTPKSKIKTKISGTRTPKLPCIHKCRVSKNPILKIPNNFSTLRTTFRTISPLHILHHVKHFTFTPATTSLTP